MSCMSQKILSLWLDARLNRRIAAAFNQIAALRTSWGSFSSVTSHLVWVAPKAHCFPQTVGLTTLSAQTVFTHSELNSRGGSTDVAPTPGEKTNRDVHNSCCSCMRKG
jgi:hypothetical protein